MNEYYISEHVSFNQLYREYHPRFVRFANTYVRDNNIAEDLTTEAIIYYWENRLTLKQESNVPAYILTVIKHKCLNYLRHIQIREEYLGSAELIMYSKLHYRQISVIREVFSKYSPDFLLN